VLEVLQRGAGRKPDVRLVAWDGEPAVVKDFAGRAPWLRATLGRWLVARELRAYRALAGHPDVPRLLGRVGRHGFAVEHRPGRRLSRQRAAELPPDFLDRLERAVRGMHERGVVHLDLRHRSNVLVGHDGAPVLIDFASAVCLRPGRWPDRVLLRWLARVDERALAKWRRKLAQPPLGAGGGPGGSSDGGRSASRPM
jgi:predicted Ser/Thr protein kinase